MHSPLYEGFNMFNQNVKLYLNLLEEAAPGLNSTGDPVSIQTNFYLVKFVLGFSSHLSNQWTKKSAIQDIATLTRSRYFNQEATLTGW